MSKSYIRGYNETNIPRMELETTFYSSFNLGWLECPSWFGVFWVCMCMNFVLMVT